MQVGPLAAQTVVDFREAMDVMFWGAVYPTLAVLPQMVARRSGRIANITSIGGKVAMPHLLPYDCAKFAAVAFSEGLRAELAKDGVKVTTVVPGLMRTGAHVNAYFKGDNQSEYTWFSLGATLPLVSIDARRAARKIVHAIRGGRAEIILTPQAKLLAMFHGLFPGLTADILSLVNRVLPTGAAPERHTGKESATKVSESFATVLGRKAAANLNQFAKGQSSA
jgi:short-subunit dehydrogenase